MAVDFEMKYKDLADRVITLLDRQQDYFKTRRITTLKECKQLEKSMRKECAEIVYGTKKTENRYGIFSENVVSAEDFI